MERIMEQDKPVSQFDKNKLVRSIIYTVLLLCFGAVSAFPFLYQTTTLWYKLGIDRVLLLSGQLAGCYAAFFLLLQFLLITKYQPVVAAFGIGRLNTLHRLNGKLIMGLAILHVLLILLPEGLENLPIGMKFWPEMVGGLLLLVIFSLFLVFYFKKILTYPVFKLVHRLLGILAFILVLIHVLNVSDAFSTFGVKAAVFIFAFCTGALFLIGKVKR